MLLRSRHFLFVFMLALLAAPMLIGAVVPSSQVETAEFRRDSVFPGFPENVQDWKKFPGHIDNYLRDRFGFRHWVIATYNFLSQQMLGVTGSELVMHGEDGWLFYRGEDTLSQSSGKLVRTDRIEETAEILTAMRDAAESKGVKFIFASPPNAATIYHDKIPGWPDMVERRTEYGLLDDELDERKILAVDLRPVLMAEREKQDVYLRSDTHWNPRGAVAAFNSIAAEAGHSDWRIEPSSVLKPIAPTTRGDLLRMLGIAGTVSNPVEDYFLPASVIQRNGTDPQAFEMTPKNYKHTVLLLGDSFTEKFFPRLFEKKNVRLIWRHHAHCGFNWSWVDKLKVDEIWYMPTERSFLCREGRWPQGLPRNP